MYWKHFRRNVMFDAPTNGGGGGGATFTQEQVNAILAKEKGKVKEKLDELTRLNQQLKQDKTLTTEERDTLKTKIEEIEQTYASDTEKLEKMWSKKYSKIAEELNTTSESANLWKKRFVDSEIKKQVLSAAKNAINPNQILDLLSHKVTVEETQDGLSFKIGDKDIANAITEMEKDVTNYGNLFKSQKQSGVPISGQTGTPKPGEKSLSDLAKEIYGE